MSMGMVLLIAVCCLSVVYAALCSVIYMFGSGSVEISYKNLYYWVDTSTGKGNFYRSCTDGSVDKDSSTDFTTMAQAVNAIKNGGNIYMLSTYVPGEGESVSVNTKTITIQRYVSKTTTSAGVETIKAAFTDGPLFDVSTDFKIELAGTKPCLAINGNEVKGSAGAFKVSNGAKLTLNNSETTSITSEGNNGGIFTINENYCSLSIDSSDSNVLYDGGAIYALGGQVDAKNIRFEGNRSTNTGEAFGGAIYATNNGAVKSDISLENCSFTNNTARNLKLKEVMSSTYAWTGVAPAYGGAVCVKGSTVNMTQCTFTGNAVDVYKKNNIRATGGAVYIDSTSSGSMKDCTVESNQSSYCIRSGAGVCVEAGDNAFALSGKTIIKNNSCYFVDPDSNNGINANDNLYLSGDGSNISIDTSKISEGSNIFVNVNPEPAKNGDLKALISDDIHKASSADFFHSDIGGYKAQIENSSNYKGLYLVSSSEYDDLWYRVVSNVSTVTGYDYKSFFYKDKSGALQDTGLAHFVDAVASLNDKGTIHMQTIYNPSISETITLPGNKNVNVIRENDNDESYSRNSMFGIGNVTFTVNAADPSSSITFDGNKSNAGSVGSNGGVFEVYGTSTFVLNGADKSTGDGKTITIKDSKVSSYKGGGVLISSGSSSISNCAITGCESEGNNGGGIYYYVGDQDTATLKNCTITGNKASLGGGIYCDNTKDNLLLLGKVTIKGNTNGNGADDNLYFRISEYFNPTVTLTSSDSTLSDGSEIGVATSKSPEEGSPVKFASSATEAMKACFTPDVSDYVVRFASNENALYLAVPTYSELWYKADENDSNTKKFFEGSDVNNLTATDITKFSKAVQSMSASGKIHMLTTYESAADETTTVTAGKNVTVLRDGTFNNASMFSITKGTFEINATDASSSITFDGNKIETKVNEGGAFNANGGSINFKGADKSGGGKTITIQNNIISSSSAYGGGVHIYNSGANTLENCSITYNKAESSSSLSAYGGGVYISGRGTNTLTNCSITGNTISSSSPGAFGGGVYIGGSGTNTLTNCSITENKAEPSFNARGGGVCIYGGTNTLSNCSITGNTISSSSAYGGGVCIYSGTSTLTSCSITGNTISSSSSAYGGGVCIYENTTLLGTTNITGNTVKNGSDSSDSNLYLASSSYTAALSDSSGNKLSAGSQIGVTTDSDPTSGTDQKFATNAIEDEMMNYFTSDKGYVIYKQGTELYLTVAPSDLYQSDNKFYLDAEKTKLTNIKTMAEAVKIATNIHMLSAYTASSDETVEVPSGKNVTVSRHSTFANDAMIRVNGGNLTVKATDTTSSITFDGQNVETTVKYADGGIIHVAGTEGTSLTLTGADNNGTKTINFVNSFVKGPSAGGAIRNNGTATLTNCNISNNKASPTDGGSIAGGVSNFGTLTMESCLVNGNSTTGNMSGGIYAGSNAIKSTIKNCQVTNNSSKLYGGGIFLSSGGGDNSGSPVSIIEDCTVTGNTAGDSTATPAVNGYGAGIYIGAGANGTSTISRTTISKNNAAGGGGLYISDGTNTITSCTISNNQKSSWGGGVRIDGGTNKFEGCSVINNEASSRGGGFYLTKAGSTTLTRCTISGNIAPAQGGAGICFTKNADGTAGTLALSGAMSITGNNSKDSTDENNLWIGDGLTIDVSGLATEGSAIGILTENNPTLGNDLQFATNATEEMKACFTHDPDTSEVVYKDGGLYLRYIQSLYYSTKSGSGLFYNDEACTNATSYTKLSEAVGSITSKGNIYMMSQYASSADEETNVTAGKSIKVIRHKSFKDASMFKITGGTFKVNATDASSSITFDGKKIETTVIGGGAFYVDGGNINFNGADKSGGGKTIAVENNVISPSSSYADGGGVCINSNGTNTLSNCSITGNTASSTSSSASSGGVFLGGSGTNTLENCSITGNTASSSFSASGGGVFVSSGTNTLTNCSITDNKAESPSYADGGGVYIFNGTSTLLGTMNITGNIAKVGSDSSDSNLHFRTSYKVALSDSDGNKLSTSSNIGVTTYDTPKDGTDVKFATSATEEMKACFKSDIMGRAVIYKDSGLYITLGYDALYYEDGKFYGDEACTYDTGLTKLSEAVNSISSPGRIYIMSQYASSADETVDVPAGKNITVSRYKDFKNAPMFKITGGTFTVNAADATSSITFDGKKIETTVKEGGAFYVNGGSLKLSGADKSGGGKTIAVENNIISTSSSASGGGVYIYRGANTLTNCSIAGNTASAAGDYAYGGGIYASGGTNTLENCSITGNTASSSASSYSAYGGGVYLGGSGTNMLENCSIIGNMASSSSSSADARGGGVYIYSGTNTLTNCSITGNTASSSTDAYGGGVYISNGTNTLTNCSITGNKAEPSSYADGGGVYIRGGTNTLSNCSIIGNTTSSSSYGAYGGGVYISNGTNTLLGTMNITGNTVKNGSTSSDNNLYLVSGYTVALSDSSGGTLSADSHIGVTTQASAPVKFATGVTDDIAAVRFCFDDDKKANEVYRIGTELYLGKDSSVTYEKYDNLYYYRTTTTDGLFYKDSSHKNSTGITALSEAVGHLNKGGNIYFMSSYSTSTDGERVVAPPDMGEIHIIRYSSSGTTFDGESMININGLFEVTCPHTNSTIIFDGNNVSTKNTGAGILWLWQTGSARIIGASPSCKNIKFVNSIITTGGGAAIRLGGGDNVIKNCIIEGNKRTSTDSEGSGAVLLLENDSHANSTSMENCDLINNTSAGNAGALYVASGTHSFTNCNITGNKAEGSSSIIYGGGIYIDGGTNTLTNCSVTGNKAKSSSSSSSTSGGGVSIKNGTNTLTNCSITGNTASSITSSASGGGVCASGGTNTLENCSIAENKIESSATSYSSQGGGICIFSSGTNTLTNCSITGNTVSASYAYGGGIYIGGGTNPLINCSITGNTVSSYSSAANAIGGGVCIGANTPLLGTMDITGNTAKVGSDSSDSNLYFKNGYKVALSDGSGNKLSTSSHIGVTTEKTPTSSAPVQFATGASEEMKACFTADNSDYYVDYKGSDNGLYLCVRTTYNDLYYKNNNFYSDSACSNSTGITKMSEAVASMTSSGKIHMLSQYASSADETVTVLSGRNVTVLRESSFTNASMFKITGGTFTVNAPKTNSSITFDGNKDKVSVSVGSGGVFYVDGGNINLNGAEKSGGEKTIIIKNNAISSRESFVYSSGVYIANGTNTLTNCSITGNTMSAPYASGGGVYIRGGANTLTNCSIAGNMTSGSASVSGGGVSISDGTNKLTNCSITENTASGSTNTISRAYGSGGGVSLGGGTNTLESCSITRNTAYGVNTYDSYMSYAEGGGVSIGGSGTNTLTNCSITGNTGGTASASCTVYGGGVYIYSGTNTLLDKMNITGNTAKDGSDSSDSNLYFKNNSTGSCTVALSDSSGNKLSTSSQIGVTNEKAPTEGTDVQFATNATEEMKACFTADNSDYYVSYKDSGLYLSAPTRLYYSTKSGSGLFYKDEACTDSTGLTKLTDAVGSIASNGEIYMMSQYASSASETVTVPAGKNIQVIRHKNFKDASMFSITGGTFKVNATDATSSITFDGNKIETTVNKGGAFYVDGGSINFNGADKSGGGKTITIENNVIYSSGSTQGGGVFIYRGANTLENCSITGNTASSSSSASGGGVCIHDGTNTLSNCSITGNTASSSYAEGGGVYIGGNGKNTIENCSITGNTASYSSSASSNSYAYGGGVYLGGSGTNMLENCSITENTASASSSSSSSYARGGGVCSWNGTNTLTNCSITGNTVSSSSSAADGGGVCIWANTTLLGTMNITGNTAIVGSDSSDSNLYFYNKKTVALSDSNGNTLSTSSHIGVTTEVTPTSSNSIKFAIVATEEMKACFTPDDGNYMVKYNSSDKGLYLGVRYSNLYYKNNNFYSNSACSSTTGITKFSDAVSNMTSTGTIHMMGQYASSTDETTTVPAGKNIQVVRDSSFKTASMFSITGGTFTVNAPNASSSMTFDGQKITPTSGYNGGAFSVSGNGGIKLNGASKSGGGKTITIQNNIISNSSSNAYGGGVYIGSSGANTLTNCNITGNKAESSNNVSAYCGGIYIAGSGTSKLADCSITSNTVSGPVANGGGVYLKGGTNTLTNCSITGNKAEGSAFAYGGGMRIEGGTNTLESCSITGNTSSSSHSSSYANGGGVHLYDGTNTMLGTMNITGNSAGNGNNLHIATTGAIALSSGSKFLSTSSKIGVTTKAPTSSTPVQFATGATSAMASCFTPDNSSYKVTYSSSALSLAVK